MLSNSLVMEVAYEGKSPSIFDIFHDEGISSIIQVRYSHNIYKIKKIKYIYYIFAI